MLKVPALKEPELVKFLNDLVRELADTEKETLSSITANRSVLLYSPSSKVFEITVSDTGVLTATKVSGT